MSLISTRKVKTYQCDVIDDYDERCTGTSKDYGGVSKCDACNRDACYSHRATLMLALYDTIWKDVGDEFILGQICANCQDDAFAWMKTIRYKNIKSRHV